MWAVVEWSTTKPVHLNNTAEYAAKGGFKQKSSDQSSISDLDKGGNSRLRSTTAEFGSKLKIPVTSGNYYKDTTLTLEIK